MVEHLIDFLKIFLNIFVSVVFIEIIKKRFNFLSVKQDFKKLVYEQLLNIVSPKHVRYIYARIMLGKIDNTPIRQLRSFLDFCDSQIINHIHNKSVTEFIQLISDLLTHIDMNYKIDNRYDDTVVFFFPNEVSASSSYEGEKNKEKMAMLQRYKELSNELYNTIIKKFPSLIIKASEK